MRQWHFLQFSLHPRHLEPASAIVAEMGTRGIHEQPLQSGQVQLKAYFDPCSDIGRVCHDFQALCRKADVPLAGFTAGVEAEKDWLKEWRRRFRPFPVGNRWWISPGRDSSQAAVQNRIPIWLEPQMAFGSGTHESTQLCLEVLETLPLTGRTVLDIGTGSGILAMAAAKSGAESVLAFDIDPVAVQVAESNFSRNRVGHRIHLFTGEVAVLGGSAFDVILANLEGTLIQEQLNDFSQHLKPEGRLVLSGLLGEDATRICRSASVRALPLTLLQELAKGEWRCLVFGRNRMGRRETL